MCVSDYICAWVITYMSGSCVTHKCVCVSSWLMWECMSDYTCVWVITLRMCEFVTQMTWNAYVWVRDSCDRAWVITLVCEWLHMSLSSVLQKCFTSRVGVSQITRAHTNESCHTHSQMTFYSSKSWVTNSHIRIHIRNSCAHTQLCMCEFVTQMMWNAYVWVRD